VQKERKKVKKKEIKNERYVRRYEKFDMNKHLFILEGILKS